MKKLILLPILFILLATPPSAIAQESGYATSVGVDIYYEIYGSGDPLLLINGGPGFSSEGFQALANKLGKKYRVILYDQRGTGRSEMVSFAADNMTMSLMAADIEALRRHLEIKEWMVMGHSFGGVLGNYYVAHYPEYVKALIASASGGIDLKLSDYFDITQQLTPVQRDSFRYWSSRISNGRQSSLAEKKRRMYMAAAYVYDDSNVPLVAERLGQGNLVINRLIWQDLRRIEYDVSVPLSGFTKPVLIVQGQEDIIRPETAERAHAVFPHSELVLIPHCGHYGWLDQPDLYFKTIHDFIARSVKG